MGKPKTRPRLSKAAARREAIRRYLEGHDLGRICMAVERRADVVLEWVSEISIKELASVGRVKLGQLYAISLTTAVELTRPEAAKKWTDNDGVEQDETPRQRVNRLGAAKLARENGLAAWRVLQEMEAANRRERPPAPKAEPEVVTKGTA